MASLIYFLIVGLIAGWAASMLMRGRGYGPVADLVVGVIGAIIGGYVFALFGLQPTNLFGSLVTSVIGAVLLLAIVKSAKKIK